MFIYTKGATGRENYIFFEMEHPTPFTNIYSTWFEYIEKETQIPVQ